MEHTTLYIVWEDNHGDVSYWLSLTEADKEASKIIADMYDGDDSVRGELVGVREVDLNKPW